MQSVFQMLLSMCLLIIDKKLWTWLISSNFQNGAFEITTITVTEILFSQVFFTVASKQKNENENKESGYHSKVSSSIISLCLDKVKDFLIILACQSYSTLNVCRKTVNEFYVFLTRLNGYVFVYEFCRCGIDSPCSYLNFRYHVPFQQGAPWHLGN